MPYTINNVGITLEMGYSLCFVFFTLKLYLDFAFLMHWTDSMFSFSVYFGLL